MHEVIIGEHASTPGFLAGMLPAGEWTAIVNTHRIEAESGATCDYMLTIDDTIDTREVHETRGLSHEMAATAAGHSTESPRVLAAHTHTPTNAARAGADASASDEPSWLRGDLHAHTHHSDGRWGIADLLRWARKEQLDFATLSDHNTSAPQREMLQASAPELLTMIGTELTTFHGHALALGVEGWVDWRLGETRTMPRIAEAVERAGGLFIIAHPRAIGDPACTGCRWDYAEVMPSPAKIVEVWNGGTWFGDSYNELGLARFYQWLNDGHRLVATAGTDIHGLPKTDAPYGFNVVYAPKRTREAILDAIRRGHLYLSSGPRLELRAALPSGASAMMGDTLPTADTRLKVTWERANGATLRIIIDGQPVVERPITDAGHYAWTVHPREAKWCSAELRDDGRLTALTNPIFFA